MSFDELNEVLSQSIKLTSWYVINSVANCKPYRCKYHNVCIIIRYVELLLVMEHVKIKKYLHTYIHTYIHTYTYSYIYLHTHTQIYAHTYIHTYLRTYIHIYIYT